MSQENRAPIGTPSGGRGQKGEPGNYETIRTAYDRSGSQENNREGIGTVIERDGQKPRLENHSLLAPDRRVGKQSFI